MVRKWDHDGADHCMERDYLGRQDDPTYVPLFNGAKLDEMFRVSKARYEKIKRDILEDGDPFFLRHKNPFTGELGASTEAKILLPLKTMAYGVPPRTFTDYFQMSLELAREACLNFR